MLLKKGGNASYAPRLGLLYRSGWQRDKKSSKNKNIARKAGDIFVFGLGFYGPVIAR
jgi:hypothetical protein